MSGSNPSREGKFDDAERYRRRPRRRSRIGKNRVSNLYPLDDLFVVELVRARPSEIDNRERKRIHKFRDAARVRLYENYKAINYDRDKLSSRGAIIEREPR